MGSGGGINYWKIYCKDEFDVIIHNKYKELEVGAGGRGRGGSELRVGGAGRLLEVGLGLGSVSVACVRLSSTVQHIKRTDVLYWRRPRIWMLFTSGVPVHTVRHIVTSAYRRTVLHQV